MRKIESVSDKHIVFINQDSGYLMIDIVNAFADSGYKCTLLTGRLVERNHRLQHEVNLDWIPAYNRKNMISRIFSWLFGFLEIWLKVFFKYRRAELFIVSNPPMNPLLPLFCSNRYTLLFFDVYIEKPLELLPLGKYSIISLLWIYFHRKSINKADRVFTLTRGMLDTLKKYDREASASVVSVWTDNDFLKPIDRSENRFIHAHSLEGKFIVLYSGNIGKESNLESVLMVASAFKDDVITFVIIGDGFGSQAIRKKAKDLDLKNCMFLPWQSPEMLPYSMASASVAIVTLPESSGKSAIPSKVFNYLSVGVPVISIANSDSDLAKMITEQKFGRNFSADQTREITQFIRELYAEKRIHGFYSANSLSASISYANNNAWMFVPGP